MTSDMAENTEPVAVRKFDFCHNCGNLVFVEYRNGISAATCLKNLETSFIESAGQALPAFFVRLDD
jgi:hypothetical protein